MGWNAWLKYFPQEEPLDDPLVHRFLKQVCKDADVFCHPSLVPRRRTQMASQMIASGQRVLEIPRSLQIWDLDAMRNDWIRDHVGAAKHPRTDNPVDSAAYLALYMALLLRGHLSLNNDHDNDENTEIQSSYSDDRHQLMQARIKRNNNSQRLLQYLQECLPSAETIEDFHPLLWNETALLTLLLPHSASFNVVEAYRDMLESEYQAFTSSANQRQRINLGDFVSERDYRASRILVLSRSFGTGHLPNSALPRDDRQFYKREFGIDTSKGSYAMVPILDFYDHHANPNVEYSYSTERRVFVIRATASGIPAGHEVVDSYGKFTDAHLFAKFGFVNGDGSGYSQANLATQHLLLDMDLKQQFSYLPFRRTPQLHQSIQKALDKQSQDVQQYLRFDDGYKECVVLSDRNETKSHPEEAYDLKRLKKQHLARIANHVKRWNLILLPRAPESQPTYASNVPITLSPPKMPTQQYTDIFYRKDYQLVAATCRLISLTHEDYDGQATDILKKNLQNNAFLLQSPVEEGSNSDSLAAALEFRTHFCLARLASEALQKFDTSIPDLENKVALLNRHSFQSKEWAAAHLQLSEMQTLEVLRGASFSATRLHEHLRNKSPAFSIRDIPCPM